MGTGKNSFFKKLTALILVLLICINVSAFSNEPANASNSSDKRIRVDIGPDTGGRSDMYTEFWNNWVVTSGASAEATFNGVKFKLSNGGSTGSSIKSGWYKGLVQSSMDSPTLTLDGVIIDGASSYGTIKLEISGLPAGTHTLTTWHSFFDVVKGGTMSVSIDGVVKAKGIKGPTRVTKDDEAGRSYSSFTATAGKTVVVLIKPEGNGTYNNAVLNAFEIDGVNPFKTIARPSPEDGDEHLVRENGLSWTAGEGALSHDVYIGTDYDSVNNADTSSPLFKGNQTGTTYALNSSYSHMNTYYWRVDEKSAGGVTKGAVLSFRIAHLAFPGAEGYGRFARGGRGGRVIEVTSLNDSGAGSLRQALEVEKGPRVVVFRVGGVIALKSRLVVPADGGDVYVAGQTAPGDGITLIQQPFGLSSTSDTIIRHVRLRVGDIGGKSLDGMGMAGSDNCIIDHCSIAWSIDEGTSSRGAHNITFQRNIIAEALNNSVHYNDTTQDHSGTQRHSYAASISGNVGSFHHNLLTNCTGRNWSLAGGMEQDAKTYAGYLDITNNVVYNWKDRTTDGGVRRVNFVNNYYKMGPVSNNMMYFTIDGDQLGTGDMQMAYLSGNKMADSKGETVFNPNTDNWQKAGSVFSTVDKVKSSKPFFPSYVTTQTADEAYNSVINDVGATKPKQDYLDQRYIKEVKNCTYTYTGSVDKLKGIIDTQDDAGGYPKLQGGTAPVDSDHDGMPDVWETKHGLNPNDAEDRNGLQLSAEGYTNLEMYLSELAGDNIKWNDTPAALDGKYIKALTIKDSANAAEWSIQSNLQVRDTTYGDRTVKFSEIPAKLLGSEWIRTACDSKAFTSELASFTAKSDISVYVGLDSRVTDIPSWLSSWTKTGETLSGDNSVTFNLYKKDFKSGSVISLGENGLSSGTVNYTVIITPYTAPTFIYGDVNGDNSVNALDLAVMKSYLLGKITEFPVQSGLKVADVNGDTKIDALDFAVLKQYLLGKITTFPAH